MRAHTIGKLAGGILAGFFLFTMPVFSFASDDGTYITINVEATDDNEGLLYALDSTAPEAFSKESRFTIEGGSTHTIYVKDAAGNITSRSYTAKGYEPPAPIEEEVPVITGISEDPEPLETDDGYLTYTGEGSVATGKSSGTEPDVTVDVDLYATSRYEGMDAGSYLSAGGKSPAEEGNGSVYDRTETDGNKDAAMLFYTITTKDGEVFYMVIDQGNAQNNVYLLDQVTVTDLNSIAKDDLPEAESEKTRSLLGSLGKEKEEAEIETIQNEPESKKDRSFMPLIILILIGAGGGIYYYLKVYRAKKDEEMDLADAMNRDDFEIEDNRWLMQEEPEETFEEASFEEGGEEIENPDAEEGGAYPEEPFPEDNIPPDDLSGYVDTYDDQ